MNVSWNHQTNWHAIFRTCVFHLGRVHQDLVYQNSTLRLNNSTSLAIFKFLWFYVQSFCKALWRFILIKTIWGFLLSSQLTIVSPKRLFFKYLLKVWHLKRRQMRILVQTRSLKFCNWLQEKHLQLHLKYHLFLNL